MLFLSSTFFDLFALLLTLCSNCGHQALQPGTADDVTTDHPPQAAAQLCQTSHARNITHSQQTQAQARPAPALPAFKSAR
mmetsp:Transcript_13475/g.33023  ORF Transcript_13475/g.33023 Transcript_13475/m.33023 type:complete len:80 (-) Transcript_13475:5211-5450(-)